MAKPNQLPIKIRPANEEDVAFIFNSWLKSFRSSPFARVLSNEIYFAGHHKLIEKVLRRSQVSVVCNVDDSSQIFGYSVTERITGVLVIHYIYVKDSYRNMGIANTLLQNAGHDKRNFSCYTHHTKPCDLIASRYSLLYQPYAFFLEGETSDKSEPITAEN